MSGSGTDTVTLAYRSAARKRAAVALGMGSLLCLALLLDTATGPARLPVADVARSVLGQGGDTTIEAIVWSIRLPVALTALAVGAALLVALRQVAKAHGMAEVARRANMGEKTLFKSLSENGNPTISTVHKVLHAVGLRLSVIPEHA